MKAQLLRPGFMIALASSMKGGINYETQHEESERSDGGVLTEEWTTTKTVFDVEEFERAVKVRGEARYLISKLCVKTPFCLLCPEPNEAALDEGVIAAKKLCEDFNATSAYTKVYIYTLKAKLLGNDEENARAIASEMRLLMTEMGDAIQKMNPDKIREAIKKADEVSQMLVEEQQEKVSVAIDMARVAARLIKKTIKEKGIGAINVVSDYRAELLAVEAAGKVFLDFEEAGEVSAKDEVPAVQVQDLDLSDQIDEVTAAGYADQTAGRALSYE